VINEHLDDLEAVTSTKRACELLGASRATLYRRRTPPRRPAPAPRQAPAEQSTNSRIEKLLDIEDMRRRCAAHDQWMRANPDSTAFNEAWADRNLDELAER
jgi:hypothetical protein